MESSVATDEWVRRDIWRGVSAVGRDIMRTFRLHALFFVLLAVYFGSYIVIKAWADQPVAVGAFVERSLRGLPGGMGFIVLSTVALAFGYRGVRMLLFERPERLLPFLVRDSVAYIYPRLLNFLPALLVLLLFTPVFTAFKASIPHIRPFAWDRTFMLWDRALHFGLDPWRILQTVFGHEWLSFGLNFVYNLWFAVFWSVFVLVAASVRFSALRMQYLLAFFLTWVIGGSFLATIFSSAGPAFYGHIVSGENPYAPLLAYLHGANEHVPIWALETQEMMWTNYQNNSPVEIAAISAMPSMHNGTSVLMAILGWRYAKPAGMAGTVFALLIFIGSVHLGWHYAIDGYAGALIAVMCWWLAGRITRWYLALPQIRGHDRTELSHPPAG